jgi:hypothetical protein
MKQSSKQGLSVPGSRAAVWIRTDHVSFDYVNQKFRVTLLDWTTRRMLPVPANSEGEGR